MRHTASWLVFAGFLIASGVVLVLTTPEQQDPTPPPGHAPCTPLPDPAVCVQLAWLDGAWRCITVKEAA